MTLYHILSYNVAYLYLYSVLECLQAFTHPLMFIRKPTMFGSTANVIVMLKEHLTHLHTTLHYTKMGKCAVAFFFTFLKTDLYKV